jgi:hypothetical protein
MSFMNAALVTRVVSRVAGDLRLHGMVLSIAWDATGARNGSAGQGLPLRYATMLRAVTLNI